MMVDGKKKVGAQLQRCLDVAKTKAKTRADAAYGTVCTRQAFLPFSSVLCPSMHF